MHFDVFNLYLRTMKFYPCFLGTPLDKNSLTKDSLAMENKYRSLVIVQRRRGGQTAYVRRKTDKVFLHSRTSKIRPQASNVLDYVTQIIH